MLWRKLFRTFGCVLGLSPDLQSMDQIRKIIRPTDVPDTGKLLLKLKVIVLVRSAVCQKREVCFVMQMMF